MRKAFRVLITDNCNMNCPNCFNKNLRSKRDMSLIDFSELCNYLKNEGNISRIKIMGGEPTMHKSFLDIIRISQDFFNNINIFTNGRSELIEKLSLRENDSIIYNLECLPDIINANRLSPDGCFNHVFETRIDHNADLASIKHKLSQIYNILGNDMKVNLTLNCIENIFLYKDSIIDNWNDIVRFLNDNLSIGYNIDHYIPYCFFVGTKMDIKIKRNSVCSFHYAGLIAPDMTLRHCNQTENTILKLKQGNRFVPYQIVEQHLLMDYYHKLYICLSKICKDCMLFGEKCNGGCFIFKPSITRDSILSHTNLPIL